MPGFTIHQIINCARNSKACWVIYEGKVYDITDFISSHPGGDRILLEYSGADITNVLANLRMHVHSQAAYELLSDYYIGDVLQPQQGLTAIFSPASHEQDLYNNNVNHLAKSMLYENHISNSTALSFNGNIGDNRENQITTRSNVNSAVTAICHGISQQQNGSAVSQRDDNSTITSNEHPFLNLNEPLFPQLWNATFSKEFYLEHVRRSRFVSHHVPFFGHPFLDLFTYASWYMVPVIWIPIVGFYLSSSINSGTITIVATCQYFFFDLFIFTLVEYLSHRFLYHIDEWVPDDPIALLIHFTLHGIHDHIPMDR